MLAIAISPFGLNKVAPVRPCCEPSGGGWAGRTACGRSAAENLEAKRIWPSRKPHSGGELLSLQGCGHEAHSVAVPPSRFTTGQGGRGHTLPNGGWPARYSRMTASPTCALTPARLTPGSTYSGIAQQRLHAQNQTDSLV